jgi:prefoldin subunit 5
MTHDDPSGGNHSWRPNSAWNIELSDPALARIGLTVAVEAQAHHAIWMLTKPLAQLTVDVWKKREQRQLKQLIEELRQLAVDETLQGMLADFESKRERAQVLRHQIAM